MTKVINPLFSIQASGRFGGMIFSSNQNGAYVKAYKPQKFLPSAAQIKNNYVFGVLSDEWRELSDEEKIALNIEAAKINLTGYNLYIKQNWQRAYEEY